VQDSATLRVKDAKDQAALAEREALERVSSVEAENATPLASTREDAEGLPGRSPSLRTSLRRSIGPGKCLRGSAEDNLRSPPFYRPRVLSCVMPSSVPHGRGITFLRGCGLRPSTILKWPENLPCFRWWCLL
jgi:hypothetical protein